MRPELAVVMRCRCSALWPQGAFPTFVPLVSSTRRISIVSTLRLVHLNYMLPRPSCRAQGTAYACIVVL